MTATPPPHDVWMDAARVKLHRICGQERGEQLLHEALRARGKTGLASADELYGLADYFIEKGGFLEAVGHALKFQATLHGARG